MSANPIAAPALYGLDELPVVHPVVYHLDNPRPLVVPIISLKDEHAAIRFVDRLPGLLFEDHPAKDARWKGIKGILIRTGFTGLVAAGYK
jgi:hypothetical protein